MVSEHLSKLTNPNSTQEQVNLNITLMHAFSIHDWYQPTKNVIPKEGEKAVAEPFRSSGDFVQDMTEKVFAKDSATTAYKLIKSLTDEQYKVGVDCAWNISVNTAIIYSFPATKQDMLDKISKDALNAGVKINPIEGEKVTIKSIGTKLNGAMSSLKANVKEFFETKLGASKQR